MFLLVKSITLQQQKPVAKTNNTIIELQSFTNK